MMIYCPECGKSISSESEKCVYCGFPIKKKISTHKKGKRKRRSKAPLICLIVFLLVVLLGVLILKWALENGKIEITLNNTTETTDQFAAEKGLFNVKLTIPSDFMQGVTQDDLDKTAKENGFKSATLNDDGSATYVMSKAQHKKLMKDTKEKIDKELNDMVGSSDYPNFTEVTANKDYTEFTVKTTSQDPTLEEQLAVFQLYIYGGTYNAFNGTPIDNVHVNLLNSNSGDVILSADSDSMTNK
ncbi:MAG: zinc ribbon domain-containing protein [Roseburia sp.]|nr:zinc ribbon domain-containing protein [Roseburia sp.]